MNYFIRIRMTKETLLTGIDKIANVCAKVIAYEHSEKADNIHLHMLLVQCTVSTDTLKNYIRLCGQVPPRAGNKFWSFKSCDSDLQTPVVYMSKGKLHPCYVKGFTEGEIQEYKDRWVERTPETSSSKYQTRLQYVVRETPSEAKKRKNDLIKEMLELIHYQDKEHIIRIIIQVLNENHVIFGRYTIRDYYDTICARKYTDTFVNSMIDFLSYRT